MLEGWLQKLLLQHCSALLQDFSTERVSLWNGALLLRDVKLRPDVLQRVLGIDAAFRLVEGFAKELRVSVSWQRPLTVVVAVDFLNVLVERLDLPEQEASLCGVLAPVAASAAEDLPSLPSESVASSPQEGLRGACVAESLNSQQSQKQAGLSLASKSPLSQSGVEKTETGGCSASAFISFEDSKQQCASSSEADGGQRSSAQQWASSLFHSLLLSLQVRVKNCTVKLRRGPHSVSLALSTLEVRLPKDSLANAASSARLGQRESRSCKPLRSSSDLSLLLQQQHLQTAVLRECVVRDLTVCTNTEEQGVSPNLGRRRRGLPLQRRNSQASSEDLDKSASLKTRSEAADSAKLHAAVEASGEDPQTSSESPVQKQQRLVEFPLLHRWGCDVNFSIPLRAAQRRGEAKDRNSFEKKSSTDAEPLYVDWSLQPLHVRLCATQLLCLFSIFRPLSRKHTDDGSQAKPATPLEETVLGSLEEAEEETQTPPGPFQRPPPEDASQQSQRQPSPQRAQEPGHEFSCQLLSPSPEPEPPGEARARPPPLLETTESLSEVAEPSPALEVQPLAAQPRDCNFEAQFGTPSLQVASAARNCCRPIIRDDLWLPLPRVKASPALCGGLSSGAKLPKQEKGRARRWLQWTFEVLLGESSDESQKESSPEQGQRRTPVSEEGSRTKTDALSAFSKEAFADSCHRGASARPAMHAFLAELLPTSETAGTGGEEAAAEASERSLSLSAGGSAEAVTSDYSPASDVVSVGSASEVEEALLLADLEAQTLQHAASHCVICVMLPSCSLTLFHSVGAAASSHLEGPVWSHQSQEGCASCGAATRPFLSAGIEGGLFLFARPPPLVGVPEVYMQLLHVWGRDCTSEGLKVRRRQRLFLSTESQPETGDALLVGREGPAAAETRGSEHQLQKQQPQGLLFLSAGVRNAASEGLGLVDCKGLLEENSEARLPSARSEPPLPLNGADGVSAFQAVSPEEEFQKAREGSTGTEIPHHPTTPARGAALQCGLLLLPPSSSVAASQGAFADLKSFGVSRAFFAEAPSFLPRNAAEATLLTAASETSGCRASVFVGPLSAQLTPSLLHALSSFLRLAVSEAAQPAEGQKPFVRSSSSSAEEALEEGSRSHAASAFSLEMSSASSRSFRAVFEERTSATGSFENVSSSAPTAENFNFKHRGSRARPEGLARRSKEAALRFAPPTSAEASRLQGPKGLTFSPLHLVGTLSLLDVRLLLGGERDSERVVDAEAKASRHRRRRGGRRVVFSGEGQDNSAFSDCLWLRFYAKSIRLGSSAVPPRVECDCLPLLLTHSVCFAPHVLSSLAYERSDEDDESAYELGLNCHPAALALASGGASSAESANLRRKTRPLGNLGYLQRRQRRQVRDTSFTADRLEISLLRHNALLAFSSEVPPDSTSSSLSASRVELQLLAEEAAPTSDFADPGILWLTPDKQVVADSFSPTPHSGKGISAAAFTSLGSQGEQTASCKNQVLGGRTALQEALSSERRAEWRYTAARRGAVSVASIRAVFEPTALKTAGAGVRCFLLHAKALRHQLEGLLQSWRTAEKTTAAEELGFLLLRLSNPHALADEGEKGLISSRSSPPSVQCDVCSSLSFKESFGLNRKQGFSTLPLTTRRTSSSASCNAESQSKKAISESLGEAPLAGRRGFSEDFCKERLRAEPSASAAASDVGCLDVEFQRLRGNLRVALFPFRVCTSSDEGNRVDGVVLSGNLKGGACEAPFSKRFSRGSVDSLRGVKNRVKVKGRRKLSTASQQTAGGGGGAVFVECGASLGDLQCLYRRARGVAPPSVLFGELPRPLDASSSTGSFDSPDRSACLQVESLLQEWGTPPSSSELQKLQQQLLPRPFIILGLRTFLAPEKGAFCSSPSTNKEPQRRERFQTCQDQEASSAAKVGGEGKGCQVASFSGYTFRVPQDAVVVFLPPPARASFAAPFKALARDGSSPESLKGVPPLLVDLFEASRASLETLQEPLLFGRVTRSRWLSLPVQTAGLVRSFAVSLSEERAATEAALAAAEDCGARKERIGVSREVKRRLGSRCRCGSSGLGESVNSQKELGVAVRKALGLWPLLFADSPCNVQIPGLLVSLCDPIAFDGGNALADESVAVAALLLPSVSWQRGVLNCGPLTAWAASIGRASGSPNQTLRVWRRLLHVDAATLHFSLAACQWESLSEESGFAKAASQTATVSATRERLWCLDSANGPFTSAATGGGRRNFESASPSAPEERQGAPTLRAVLHMGRQQILHLQVDEAARLLRWWRRVRKFEDWVSRFSSGDEGSASAGVWLERSRTAALEVENSNIKSEGDQTPAECSGLWQSMGVEFRCLLNPRVLLSLPQNVEPCPKRSSNRVADLRDDAFSALAAGVGELRVKVLKAPATRESGQRHLLQDVLNSAGSESDSVEFSSPILAWQLLISRPFAALLGSRFKTQQQNSEASSSVPEDTDSVEAAVFGTFSKAVIYAARSAGDTGRGTSEGDQGLLSLVHAEEEFAPPPSLALLEPVSVSKAAAAVGAVGRCSSGGTLDSRGFSNNSFRRSSGSGCCWWMSVAGAVSRVESAIPGEEESETLSGGVFSAATPSAVEWALHRELSIIALPILVRVPPSLMALLTSGARWLLSEASCAGRKAQESREDLPLDKGGVSSLRSIKERSLSSEEETHQGGEKGLKRPFDEASTPYLELGCRAVKSSYRVRCDSVSLSFLVESAYRDGASEPRSVDLVVGDSVLMWETSLPLRRDVALQPPQVQLHASLSAVTRCDLSSPHPLPRRAGGRAGADTTRPDADGVVQLLLPLTVNVHTLAKTDSQGLASGGGEAPSAWSRQVFVSAVRVDLSTPTQLLVLLGLLRQLKLHLQNISAIAGALAAPKRRLPESASTDATLRNEAADSETFTVLVDGLECLFPPVQGWESLDAKEWLCSSPSASESFLGSSSHETEERCETSGSMGREGGTWQEKQLQRLTLERNACLRQQLLQYDEGSAQQVSAGSFRLQPSEKQGVSFRLAGLSLVASRGVGLDGLSKRHVLCVRKALLNGGPALFVAAFSPSPKEATSPRRGSKASEAETSRNAFEASCHRRRESSSRASEAEEVSLTLGTLGVLVHAEGLEKQLQLLLRDPLWREAFELLSSKGVSASSSRSTAPDEGSASSTTKVFLDSFFLHVATGRAQEELSGIRSSLHNAALVVWPKQRHPPRPLEEDSRESRRISVCVLRKSAMEKQQTWLCEERLSTEESVTPVSSKQNCDVAVGAFVVACWRQGVTAESLSPFLLPLQLNAKLSTHCSMPLLSTAAESSQCSRREGAPESGKFPCVFGCLLQSAGLTPASHSLHFEEEEKERSLSLPKYSELAVEVLASDGWWRLSLWKVQLLSRLVSAFSNASRVASELWKIPEKPDEATRAPLEKEECDKKQGAAKEAGRVNGKAKKPSNVDPSWLLLVYELPIHSAANIQSVDAGPNSTPFKEDLPSSSCRNSVLLKSAPPPSVSVFASSAATAAAATENLSGFCFDEEEANSDSLGARSKDSKESLQPNMRTALVCLDRPGFLVAAAVHSVGEGSEKSGWGCCAEAAGGCLVERVDGFDEQLQSFASLETPRLPPLSERPKPQGPPSLLFRRFRLVLSGSASSSPASPRRLQLLVALPFCAAPWGILNLKVSTSRLRVSLAVDEGTQGAFEGERGGLRKEEFPLVQVDAEQFTLALQKQGVSREPSGPEAGKPHLQMCKGGVTTRLFFERLSAKTFHSMTWTPLQLCSTPRLEVLLSRCWKTHTLPFCSEFTAAPMLSDLAAGSLAVGVRMQSLCQVQLCPLRVAQLAAVLSQVALSWGPPSVSKGKRSADLRRVEREQDTVARPPEQQFRSLGEVSPLAPLVLVNLLPVPLLVQQADGGCGKTYVKSGAAVAALWASAQTLEPSEGSEGLCFAPKLRFALAGGGGWSVAVSPFDLAISKNDLNARLRWQALLLPAAPPSQSVVVGIGNAKGGEGCDGCRELHYRVWLAAVRWNALQLRCFVFPPLLVQQRLKGDALGVLAEGGILQQARAEDAAGVFGSLSCFVGLVPRPALLPSLESQEARLSVWARDFQSSTKTRRGPEDAGLFSCEAFDWSAAALSRHLLPGAVAALSVLPPLAASLHLRFWVGGKDTREAAANLSPARNSEELCSQRLLLFRGEPSTPPQQRAAYRAFFPWRRQSGETPSPASEQRVSVQGPVTIAQGLLEAPSDASLDSPPSPGLFAYFYRTPVGTDLFDCECLPENSANDDNSEGILLPPTNRNPGPQDQTFSPEILRLRPGIEIVNQSSSVVGCQFFGPSGKRSTRVLSPLEAAQLTEGEEALLERVRFSILGKVSTSGGDGIAPGRSEEVLTEFGGRSWQGVVFRGEEQIALTPLLPGDERPAAESATDSGKGDAEALETTTTRSRGALPDSCVNSPPPQTSAFFRCFWSTLTFVRQGPSEFQEATQQRASSTERGLRQLLLHARSCGVEGRLLQLRLFSPLVVRNHSAFDISLRSCQEGGPAHVAGVPAAKNGGVSEEEVNTFGSARSFEVEVEIRSGGLGEESEDPDAGAAWGRVRALFAIGKTTRLCFSRTHEEGSGTKASAESPQCVVLLFTLSFTKNDFLQAELEEPRQMRLDVFPAVSIRNHLPFPLLLELKAHDTNSSDSDSPLPAFVWRCAGAECSPRKVSSKSSSRILPYGPVTPDVALILHALAFVCCNQKEGSTSLPRLQSQKGKNLSRGLRCSDASGVQTALGSLALRLADASAAAASDSDVEGACGSVDEAVWSEPALLLLRSGVGIGGSLLEGRLQGPRERSDPGSGEKTTKAEWRAGGYSRDISLSLLDPRSSRRRSGQLSDSSSKLTSAAQCALGRPPPLLLRLVNVAFGLHASGCLYIDLFLSENPQVLLVNRSPFAFAVTEPYRSSTEGAEKADTRKRLSLAIPAFASGHVPSTALLQRDVFSRAVPFEANLDSAEAHNADSETPRAASPCAWPLPCNATAISSNGLLGPAAANPLADARLCSREASCCRPGGGGAGVLWREKAEGGASCDFSLCREGARVLPDENDPTGELRGRWQAASRIKSERGTDTAQLSSASLVFLKDDAALSAAMERLEADGCATVGQSVSAAFDDKSPKNSPLSQCTKDQVYIQLCALNDSVPSDFSREGGTGEDTRRRGAVSLPLRSGAFCRVLVHRTPRAFSAECMQAATQAATSAALEAPPSAAPSDPKPVVLESCGSLTHWLLLFSSTAEAAAAAFETEPIGGCLTIRVVQEGVGGESGDCSACGCFGILIDFLALPCSLLWQATAAAAASAAASPASTILFSSQRAALQYPSPQTQVESLLSKRERALEAAALAVSKVCTESFSEEDLLCLAVKAVLEALSESAGRFERAEWPDSSQSEGAQFRGRAVQLERQRRRMLRFEFEAESLVVALSLPSSKEDFPLPLGPAANSSPAAGVASRVAESADALFHARRLRYVCSTFALSGPEEEACQFFREQRREERALLLDSLALSGTANSKSFTQWVCSPPVCVLVAKESSTALPFPGAEVGEASEMPLNSQSNWFQRVPAWMEASALLPADSRLTLLAVEFGFPKSERANGVLVLRLEDSFVRRCLAFGTSTSVLLPLFVPSLQSQNEASLESPSETGGSAFHECAVERLSLSSTVVSISLDFNGAAWASLSDCAIHFPPLQLSGVRSALRVLQRELLAHYAALVLFQVPQLLASAHAFGSLRLGLQHAAAAVRCVYGQPTSLAAALSAASHALAAAFVPIGAFAKVLRRALPSLPLQQQRRDQRRRVFVAAARSLVEVAAVPVHALLFAIHGMSKALAPQLLDAEEQRQHAFGCPECRETVLTLRQQRIRSTASSDRVVRALFEPERLEVSLKPHPRGARQDGLWEDAGGLMVLQGEQLSYPRQVVPPQRFFREEWICFSDPECWLLSLQRPAGDGGGGPREGGGLRLSGTDARAQQVQVLWLLSPCAVCISTSQIHLVYGDPATIWGVVLPEEGSLDFRNEGRNCSGAAGENQKLQRLVSLHHRHLRLQQLQVAAASAAAFNLGVLRTNAARVKMAPEEAQAAAAAAASLQRLLIQRQPRAPGKSYALIAFQEKQDQSCDENAREGPLWVFTRYAPVPSHSQSGTESIIPVRKASS